MKTRLCIVVALISSIMFCCNTKDPNQSGILKSDDAVERDTAYDLYFSVVENRVKGNYELADKYLDSLKTYYPNSKHTVAAEEYIEITSSQPNDSSSDKAYESNNVSQYGNQVYSVLGEENYLYKNPSQQSQKVINQKASSTFNTTMYCQIDRSTKVKILESTNGWFKVQVVEPNWLRNSHIGWVKESVIKVNEIKGSNYIEWRSPRTREFAPIGKVLVSNNIDGCGEYKVYQESLSQYLLACTRDGNSWKFYRLNLRKNSVKKINSTSMNKPY